MPAESKKTEATIVLPKQKSPLPVVIFAYASGESPLRSGSELRRFAEIGFAAVTFDYDQEDQTNFNRQFCALNTYLQKQSWANTNQIVWIGFDLGAQRMLSLALQLPEVQPQVFALLDGAIVPELQPFLSATNRALPLPLKCSIALVHGENSEAFASWETIKFNQLLAEHGIQTVLHVFQKRGNGLEADRNVFYRVFAEKCKSRFQPTQKLEILAEKPKGALPFALCIAPSFLWAGFWLRSRLKVSSVDRFEGRLNLFEKILRCAAVVLATFAVIEIALYLIPPRLKVSDTTIAIARRQLIAPQLRDDFDEIAGESYWRRYPVKTLLTHVELSNYCVYELINWKVPKEIYHEYILSPVIDTESDPEMNWRRHLWQFFYPRVRKENDTRSAAEIVVRNLRERVTIDPRFEYSTGIESIWKNQVTTPAGFERIYVAALRSAGIPTRLNAEKRAEFWNGLEWEAAPRPLVETWLE